MLDFLGIGAQKAGTTWVYHHLKQHPELRFPGGKEIHYWDQQYPESFENYSTLFADQNPFKLGEITPAYAIIPHKTVEALYAFAPHIRIFFITRNPIDRAWSSALMALERAEMTFDEASDQWFIDHFYSLGSRLRGNYPRTLDIWKSVFPEEQILVLRFEDISHNPYDFLKRLCRHLGVDSQFFDAQPERVHTDKIFANASHPLSPKLLDVLKEIYPSEDFFHS